MPLTATLMVAEAPGMIVCDCGCWVIIPATHCCPGVTVAMVLSAEPPAFVTRTQYDLGVEDTGAVNVLAVAPAIGVDECAP